MQQSLTVFFSDIANSTRLYQEQGDIQAHRLITECLHDMRHTVEMHNGTLLRTVGDAVLASFERSDDAMQAAVESQRLQLQSPLTIRIGFHVGVVIPDAGDVYGNAVNVAARVASFANASEIFTTGDTVRQLSVEMRQSTTYLDSVDFKGIQEPLPVYRVQWQEVSTMKPVVDTRIVTAVKRSERFRSDMTLSLLVGAQNVQVDENNPRVSIGRDIDNDIIVDHESTSRHHAVVEFQRGRYLITDSSTNGTYLVRNGISAVFVRRESIVLENDGVIGAGWQPDPDDAGRIIFRSVRQTLQSPS